jgi:hypothetical protein
MSLLVGIVALLTVAVHSVAANAERIGFEPAGEITISGPLSITSGGITFECAVTMTGTLTRELVSTAPGTAIGELTGGTAVCEGISVRILIPRIAVIAAILRPGGEVIGVLASIRNFGVLIDNGIFRCLYGGELGILVGVGREAAAVTVLNIPPLRLVRSLNLFTCPAEATLGGTMSIRPAQRVIFLP